MPTLFTMYISYSLCIILLPPLPSPLSVWGGGGATLRLSVSVSQKRILFSIERNYWGVRRVYLAREVAQRGNSSKLEGIHLKTPMLFCCRLKGTVSRDFLLLFFSWMSFPPAQGYPIRTVLNFSENLRRYSQVKVHHWYQRHRRQICHRCKWPRRQTMGTIMIVENLKWTCRKKIIYMLTLLPKGEQKK